MKNEINNYESLNRLAYLNTVEKKPFDIVLQIIELECFELKINVITKETKKMLIEKLKSIYNIEISDAILDNWLRRKFLATEKQLVLKASEQKDIQSKFEKIKKEEEQFIRELSQIRKNFGEFAKNEFNIKLSNEEIKDIFNNYLYSVSNDSELKNDINIKFENYFIFKEYLRSLLNNNMSDLIKIENLGIANQIQNMVINDIETDNQFLEGCVLYLDTPILMKRLGYDGKELHDSYEDFLNNLTKAGARLVVFEHTFEELWGILFNFKRCVSQKIFNAKGVNTFLQARKEFDSDEVIPLDKDNVRKNIEKLQIEFEQSIIAQKEGFIDPNEYSYFTFNENRFREILIKNSPSFSKYETRLKNDVDSVASINRIRLKNNLTNCNTYKDAKYFLLVDNFDLIKAIKEYHGDELGKNELLFESTILFSIWQNLYNNDDLNRTLFRSKCFALNTIDEKFKEKLYQQTRRLEIYEPDLLIVESYVDNPSFEKEIYEKAIKEKKTYDEQFLNITSKNKITAMKKEYEDLIRNKEEVIKEKDIEYKNNISQMGEQYLNNEKEMAKIYEDELEQATKDKEDETIKGVVKNLSITLENEFKYKVIIFIKMIFNPKFDKAEYLKKEAEKKLGLRL